MRAFLMLVKKDLLQYFSKRRALVLNIAAPILIGAFFGYVFGGSHSDGVQPIDVAVIDLDQSAVSTDFVANLKHTPELALMKGDGQGAMAALKAGKIVCLVTIPKDFGAKAAHAFVAGPPLPELQIDYDPSQVLAMQVVRSIFAAEVVQSVTKSVFGSALASTPAAGLAGSPLGDLAALGKSGLKPSFVTHETAATARSDEKYNGHAHSMTGMAVQFILFMGIDLGIGLLEMRRLDIWKRLRAAPLSKSTLILSRMASTGLIALIIFCIIFAAAMLLFGVRIEGSVIGFAGVVLSFCALTASFGLMIAAIGKSPEATRALAIVATLLLVMLGGAWVPSFVFPKWLQQFSLITPTRWAVDGLDGMTWRALDLSAALAPIAVLLGFTVVFAALALARFDWRE